MALPGIIQSFEFPRSERVRESLEGSGRVTFSVDRDTGYPSRGIALVGFSHSSTAVDEKLLIEYVCEFRRRTGFSSLDDHASLSLIAPVAPLPLNELRLNLPSHLQRHLSAGVIPPETWKAVVETLRRLRPNAAAAIIRLAELLSRRIPPVGDAERIAAFEKDGVYLALEFSGLPRQLAHQQALHNSMAMLTTAPFLVDLGGADTREDPNIIHDAGVFGNWRMLARYAVGAVVFKSNGNQLTVLNVNRQPLEHTLGVDLLYYSHLYEAFVMVQYKNLRRESQDWVYRPSSDSSLKKELKRMLAIEPSEWQGDVPGYRLSSGACFLKFCRNHLDDPLSTQMIPGYYVPLDLWQSVVDSGKLQGPRGGVIVTPQTLGRHFSNTEFISWIAGGWIGSRGQTTSNLNKIVRKQLARGNSMLLAVHKASPA